MRVAYVCLDPGVPVFGRKGSSIHCQEIIRAFLQRGCTVEVFARRIGKDVPFDLNAVPVHKLGDRLESVPEKREKQMVASNPEVLQALESAGPFDLVYERYSLWHFAGMKYASELQSTRHPGSQLAFDRRTETISPFDRRGLGFRDSLRVFSIC